MSVDVQRAPEQAARARGAISFNKGAFYRLCRTLHGYLSALAFIALIFFSVTGILLNHPDWFGSGEQGRTERGASFSAARINQARHAADPARALADLAIAEASPRGAYVSGEIFDGEAMLRFEGVTGASDVTIDLATGRAVISERRASLTHIMHDLHRGKNAGAVWKAVIDIVAAIVLALSLIGYILFFSLRFRLASSIALTVLGLALGVAVVLLAVP